MDLTVVNNQEKKRYEARTGPTVAGYSVYQATASIMVIEHTEVDPAYEGQGVGSALVQGMLDDIRAKGQHQVLAVCPFVRSWLGKHHDYRDLVYGAAPSHVTD
ncbi:GNAT family N-acetyltransferase [Phycicoccus ginsengisoli]